MKPRLLLAALLLPILASAVEINFTSPAFESGVNSGNTALTTGFTFALGSFGEFTPTNSNTVAWDASFTLLDSVFWDDTFTQFSGTATLATNTDPFATTTQAYIWGYDAISGVADEWILFTNPGWLFPSSADFLPTGWDISDAGTTTIVGELADHLGATPYLQTASVSAVPEPGTTALVIALAMAGVVGHRIRRRRTAT